MFDFSIFIALCLQQHKLATIALKNKQQVDSRLIEKIIDAVSKIGIKGSINLLLHNALK